MRLPILYSRTSLEQIQTWGIEIVKDRYRTYEGILDGIITESEWTTAKGKNITRSNETSPSQQALKEAKSKHREKIESGYFENVEDIDKQVFFEPMLAHTYTEETELPIVVATQPKLDGLRAIINNDGAFSRNGKRIITIPHILKEARSIIDKGFILDGELYNPELKHDFNKIVSLAKKTKPTEEDLAESEKNLQYWVYDLYHKDRSDLTFNERFRILKDLIKNTKLFLVPTVFVAGKSVMDIVYQEYLSQGYEGQIIRLDGPYENKRSRNLLKRKPMHDEEFELVDIESGRGGHANIAARAILKTKEGIVFDVGLFGSHEYCADLLVNKSKIIGKMATVVYQNLTPDGKPRFGKLKTIRWDL